MASELTLGNKALKENKYLEALELYKNALARYPELGSIIRENIKYTERKLKENKLQQPSDAEDFVVVLSNSKEPNFEISANTDVKPTRSKKIPGLIGNLDRLDRDGYLSGWAAINGSVDRLEVAVVTEGGEVLLATASTLRGDLAAKKINDGRHGFSVSVPLHLSDGDPHVFELYEASTGAFIAERTFHAHRRPVDLYELRVNLDYNGVLLLVCNFHRQYDLFALARQVKARVQGKVSVVSLEYATRGSTETSKYCSSAITITILRCSPGLNEGEVLLSLLRARVLSGFNSVLFVGNDDDGSQIMTDVEKLSLDSSAASIGLAARQFARVPLDAQSQTVVRDWCEQLSYVYEEETQGLECAGLLRIEPALISEMGALDLEHMTKVCESLARDGHFLALAFGFMELLARHGRLQVVSHDEMCTPRLRIGQTDPKYIAFYLPQFHPIHENDKWWGKGFTEWRNVVRASPLFKGHYQPRTPADLGFYDLRVKDVQREQARIAMSHGLDGFCYYYYWFDGVRLLNSPIDSLMQSGAPDFPFCICWANENWTRNWDGHNRHILIQQNYSFESNRRFIREIIPILSDPRYISYGGRPLLIVYRILHMDNWAKTAQMWREECRTFGLGEIHLAAVRTNFDTLTDEPADYGLDSFVLFPPHEVRNIDRRGDTKELRSDFSGQLYGYADVVSGDLERYKEWDGGLIHRGAMMAWDNTARRLNHARVYTGATPMKFRAWVQGIAEQESSREGASPLIFVNAWNEWAEGTYLEPDNRFGYAYLETIRSLSRRAAQAPQVGDGAEVGERLPRHLHLDHVAPGKKLPDLRARLTSWAVSHCEYRQGRLSHANSRQTVLVCAHYVGKHVFGGERSLLNVMEALAHNSYDVVAILPSFENEEYVQEIISLARTVYLIPYKQWQAGRAADEHLVLDVCDVIVSEAVDLLYANTIVLHEPLVAAKRLNVPVVIHVRELIDRDEGLCQQIGLSASQILGAVQRSATGIIANSEATYRLFGDADNVYLAKNCVSSVPVRSEKKNGNRLRFGMVSSNIPKKGLDDLIKVARLAGDRGLQVDFINVGPINGYVNKLLSETAVPPNLKFVGYREGPESALVELDVLLSLSSFAESFGRTVAEALSYGKPVIAYRHGALDELVVDGESGFLVPYQDTDAVVDRINYFVENKKSIDFFGHSGRAHIESKYSQSRLNSDIGRSIGSILERVGRSVVEGGHYKKRDLLKFARPVTIVVPIFNGYEYIKRCVESLVRHVPNSVASIILIDDCSTDKLVQAYLREISDSHGYRLISNTKNIGYTRTVNLGIQQAGTDDVVLLNSDAEVTDRWLAGLRVAAYFDPLIGTATAMSDNAGAFSFPTQGVRNEIPVSVSRDQMTVRVLVGTGDLRPVEVTTGSGFCMYIKRALLEEIGLFDEAAFPRGYGEENDLCMRALASGWKNVISPWSYVYHERTVSFGSEKEQLVKDGVAIVMARYPDYGARTQQAFSSAEMLQLRERVRHVFCMTRND